MSVYKHKTAHTNSYDFCRRKQKEDGFMMDFTAQHDFDLKTKQNIHRIYCLFFKCK